MLHEEILEADVWVDEVSDKVKSFLSLAVELTNIPWENTCIPSDKIYFSEPNLEVFSQIHKQLVSVLLVRLIAVLKENKNKGISENVINRLELSELEMYVKVMLKHYLSVAYHSCEHALHVTLNANKLLSFLLKPDETGTKISYGIQSSAIMQFAFIFSALIHDAKHLGVTNRTLSMEAHELAILYNDQSMLEQRSLTISFKEFLKPCYDNLRNLIFNPDYFDNYNKFRRLVVDIVLSTDIASTERMQLTKSKFDEAFGKMFSKKRCSSSGRCDSSSEDESIRSNEEKESKSRRLSSLPSNIFLRRGSYGIRMSLDFSSLTMPRFSYDKKIKENNDQQSNNKKSNGKNNLVQNDPLKAQVILELMIRAADIGATMQSFESFTRWGRRLYFEQKTAFEAGRGGTIDPDSFWLNGQITFLDSYSKQLAKSIQDTNAFGENDNILVYFVEENIKKWSELGIIMTATTQEDWKQERLRIYLKNEGK